MSKGKLINYAKTGKRKQLDDIEDNFKKQDDQNYIYDAVMEDFSGDYLTYINDLVKATKTPIKDKLSRQKLDMKPNNKDLKQNEQIQFKQEKKSSSRRKKEYCGDASIYEKLSIKREEQKPRFFNIQHHPIEKDQTTNVLHLLRDSQNFEVKRRKTTKDQEQDSHFIENINEYIAYLQSNHHYQQKRAIFQQRMARIDELVSQNKRLKKQLNLYKQNFKEIQVTIQQHENHLKNRERQYKSKIKQLNNALINAVKKINDQKQEIDELQSFMDNFTNQVTVYKTQKNQKSRLRHLLKGQIKNVKEKQTTIQDNQLKSFNSEQIRMQQIIAKAKLVNQDIERGAISSDENSEDQGISKIMNTTSVLPASRLKYKKMIPKIQISKSRSKQSKTGMYHKNVENINKAYRFKQSDSDSQ